MINKTTVTRKTQKGATIEVTVEQGTWEEKVTSDGWDVGNTRTHVIDRITVTLSSNGKVVASETLVDGKLNMVDQYFVVYTADGFTTNGIGPNYNKLIAQGAVARVGNAYVSQEAVDLINSAIAEANEKTEKTNAQKAIEEKKAQEKSRQAAWEKSPAGKAAREADERYANFRREMEREDSDY